MLKRDLDSPGLPAGHERPAARRAARPERERCEAFDAVDALVAHALDEELAPFIVGHESRAVAAVDVENPTASADPGLQPRRVIQQEPEFARLDRVGAAAGRPSFSGAQRGPRVNADNPRRPLRRPASLYRFISPSVSSPFTI